MKVEHSGYSFKNTGNIDVLKDLEDEWMQSLCSPQDDMWESFMNYAAHWEILYGFEQAGYACVNDENCLLQFYLSPEYLTDGPLVFRTFIRKLHIKKAIIGTNNPVCLSIAMHHQKSVHVNTYLFSNYLNTDIVSQSGSLRCAEIKDLEKITLFYIENDVGNENWIKGYVSNLLERGEFFLFEQNEEILGSCEVRKSDSNPRVANVGMIVSPAHRNKGLGTFLLGKAKEIALKLGREPICSCEKDNTGSLKAIQKNGFRSVHQMLELDF